MGAGELIMALGLMLILEGLMPFAAPAVWRETFRRAIELRDGQLRFIGALSLALGLVLILLAR